MAGTIVRDEEGVLAGELNQHGQKLLVAKGGKGGRGNEHFKTHRMNAPAFAERGEEGAEVRFRKGVSCDQLLLYCPLPTHITHHPHHFSPTPLVTHMSEVDQHRTQASGGRWVHRHAQRGQEHSTSRLQVTVRSPAWPPCHRFLLYLLFRPPLIFRHSLTLTFLSLSYSFLSNAKPKIADYAFTTVVPNLGVCDIDGNGLDDLGKGLVLVDIPGKSRSLL